MATLPIVKQVRLRHQAGYGTVRYVRLSISPQSRVTFLQQGYVLHVYTPLLRLKDSRPRP
jgi:hypothetical protein